MGGRSRFERLGSTSTSSGEGGEDFPMTTTFIKQHQSQTLIPSNNSTASSSSPAKKRFDCLLVHSVCLLISESMCSVVQCWEEIGEEESGVGADCGD